MRKTIFLKNLFTLLLLMVISWEVSGQEKEIIYFEDFGTTGTNDLLKNYTGWTTSSPKPAGEIWRISLPYASGPSTDFSGTASGKCYAHINKTPSEVIFDLKNKLSYYSEISLEFLYFKGPAKDMPNIMQLLFSSDGGQTWSDDLLPVETGKRGWYKANILIGEEYYNNFIFKFITDGTDIYRLDDIKISGKIKTLLSCDNPVISSGISTTDDVIEVAKNSNIIISCETPESRISYQINNGEVITGVSPVKLLIQEDCQISTFAFIGDGSVKSENVIKSVYVLTGKKQVFSYNFDGKQYALVPKSSSLNNWLEAKLVETGKDGNIILTNLNLFWEVLPSRKEDRYYIRSSDGGYMYADFGKEHIFNLGNNATAWIWDNQVGAFYCYSAAGEILSLFCSADNANKAPAFRPVRASVNTYGKFFKFYAKENCSYVLEGDHEIKAINEILQREDLKWIDLTKTNPIYTGTSFISPVNPNCLIFTSDAGLGFPLNEIIDAGCEYLELTDNKPFFAPREFKASEATYSRMAWQDGGWETIMLPYPVETLPADYIFDEFAGISADNTQVTFRQVTSLEANKPYMMKYVGADKTNGQAKCAFTVSNVVISPEMQNTEFTGVYTKTPTAGKFILGVKNGETIFGKGGSKSYVNPFRAYLDITLDAQAGPMRVTHQPLGATGIEDTAEAEWYVWSGEPGEIVVRTPVSKLVNVVSVEGRLVRSVKMETGEQRIEGLSAGLYIVNGKKIVVK